MLVTRVTPVSKQKFEVEMEGQLTFVVYKGELSRYCILEGREIPREKYEDLMKELEKRAKLRTMHLLTRMDRTEAEIRRKLQKDGYPEELIEIAVSYVKSYHYLDDERYARQYLRSQVGKKSWRMAEQDLLRKGVSREHIMSARQEEEEEAITEEEQIRILAEKKLRGRKISNEKELQKLYGFLLRKGYPGGEVYRILQTYMETDSNC